MLVNNIWSGYLDDVSLTFDQGVKDLQGQIDEALKKLSERPSDPALLAQYQSKLSEYNLYRNAQSNTVKVFKDIDAAIIQNFR
ncbi:type III secretion system needle complex protein [Providencia alcalifaciens]|uniref:Type III secretion apparatus needle protein n=1 Tax=Providencia alcalifaciens 205/92 TaxID=1256988 RepID=A0AAV3M0A1_9GAMM|nr:type III secretion system needle complex protein [Providencia alcalifaciens]EUD04243.1 type III secretion apparatus needle protein [Providencia alcalifaciens RIMD 1656011]EUD09208.1 type III secretion apparatus needle protein [Providencia alcalifaciens 205/92]MTC25764.1 type III secretion system needle complex protein [Providencia alcalifaciens]MTC62392.1 type III secretion system needle complex protein [Providencia alcalifaciens]WGZ56325.1 type III secretion system needle complex protein [